MIFIHQRLTTHIVIFEHNLFREIIKILGGHIDVQKFLQSRIYVFFFGY